MPERKKYTIWLDGCTDGWSPYEFDSLQECFDHMRGFAHSGAFRITRDVDVEIREKAAVIPPYSGMDGIARIAGIVGPFNA